MKPLTWVLFLLSSLVFAGPCETDLAVLGRIGKEFKLDLSTQEHSPRIFVFANRKVLEYALPSRREVQNGVDLSLFEDRQQMVVAREGMDEIENHQVYIPNGEEIWGETAVQTHDPYYRKILVNGSVFISGGIGRQPWSRNLTLRGDGRSGPHIDLFAMSFSDPHKKQVAIANEAGQVVVYSLPEMPHRKAKYYSQQIKGLPKSPSQLEYSPGKDPQLAFLSDGHVYIQADGKAEPVSIDKKYTKLLWINPSTLALATEEGPIEYWAVKVSENKIVHFKTLQGHEGPVTQMGLAKGPDFKKGLVTLGSDGVVGAAVEETYRSAPYQESFLTKP